MKLTFNSFILGLIILLVGINIAIFVKGISLSNEIHYYEKELSSLRQQNVDYEQKIYKMESYTLTASLAAELDYGKYNDPIYSELPQYALNK